MYTRCFERTYYDRLADEEVYEVINLGEYDFEWYVNNKLVRVGLVENVDETIEFLKNEYFEEVI